MSLVTGEQIRTTLKAGTTITNGTVDYYLQGEQLTCTNLFSGDKWPATWSIEELVQSGRSYRVREP